MSTDHADQYPEVDSDDSALVPPQGNPQSEWPKKIRTLSAGELDRLTIDGAGRFYWDGHLVNYQAPSAGPAETPMAAPRAEPMMGRSPDSAAVDLDALAILDRAAIELSDHRSMGQQQHAEAVVAEPALPPAPAPEITPDDLTRSMERYMSDAPPTMPAVVTPAVVAVAAVASPAVEAPMVETPRAEMIRAPEAQPRALEVVERVAAGDLVSRPERLRVSLSGWQCLGLVLVILSVLVGAAGVAAQGWVVAHDWGCRAGLLRSYCPAPATPRPAAGSDIPA